jgi:hypothetical protein
MSVANQGINQVRGAESHAKGKAFEQLFCDFMKSDLGYSNAKIRSHVKSSIRSRGTELDVIGERKSAFGRTMIRIGVFYLILCAIIFWLSFYMNDGTIAWEAVFFEVLGGAAIIASIVYNVEHAWVECKNQKDKVSLEQMQTMVLAHAAYESSNDKEFKFRMKYFVSSSGFMEDAFKYGISKDVVCYIMNKSGNFEVANFWNI